MDAIEYIKTKVKPGEPVFVLRAQDELMPHLMRIWCENVAFARGWDHPKVQEVLGYLREVEQWQKEHGCKMPD